MSHRRVSEYVTFQRGALAAILTVGLARLALSLAGLPNSSVKWLSLTGVSALAALWVAAAVGRRGFGGYKELLGLVLTQQLLAQGLVIVGIAIGIVSGQDNIFTAPEFTNTAVVREGRSWAHAGGHVLAVVIVSAVLWAVGSLVLLATRKGGSGARTPAVIACALGSWCLVAGVPARAGVLQCRDVVGELRIAPDPSCSVIHDPLRSVGFPDVVFVAEAGGPNVCFVGRLTIAVGARALTAAAALAQTVNTFPALADVRQPFTAAAIYRFAGASDEPLGALFVRQVGLNDGTDVTRPDVNEEGVVVSGSRALSGAKGTLRISGNPFEGAEVRGTLCSVLP